MTLELVELLGQSLLGGTTLAAAGFSPPGCTRLMHALGVLQGVEAEERLFGGMWSCEEQGPLGTALHTVQPLYALLEGLCMTLCKGVRL